MGSGRNHAALFSRCIYKRRADQRPQMPTIREPADCKKFCLIRPLDRLRSGMFSTRSFEAQIKRLEGRMKTRDEDKLSADTPKRSPSSRRAILSGIVGLGSWTTTMRSSQRPDLDSESLSKKLQEALDRHYSGASNSKHGASSPQQTSGMAQHGGQIGSSHGKGPGERR